MARIKAAYMTNQGKQLMFTGGQITYTKAVLYGQDLSQMTPDQVKALTSLEQPLLETPVGIKNKQDADGKSTVDVEATFQNTDLTQDLYFNSVGFFAKQGNGQEQLIGVMVTNAGAYLAAGSPDKVSTDAIDLTLALTIGDATTVNAVIDPAGSVTPTALNNAVTTINDTHYSKSDADALLDKKADKGTSYTKSEDDALLDKKADKTAVDADVSKLNQDIATKANQADLNATNKTVASKANSADVESELAKKDDTTDVDTKLATKADKTDLTSLSDTVASKASQADLDKANQAIATKADKATVDSEIGKIDFTPYAKTVDVEKELAGKANSSDMQTALQGKANTTDVNKALALKADLDAMNKALAGKENAGTSYSKAELDKKLLALSTDTGHRVDASTLTDALDTKADKSDTYTKEQVDQALAGKDSTTDVDSKIKQVTDQVNTKANASNVYSRTDIDNAFKSRDTNITDAKNTALQAQSGVNAVNQALNTFRPESDTPKANANFDLNSNFNGWVSALNVMPKNAPADFHSDTFYFQGRYSPDIAFEVALNCGQNNGSTARIKYRSQYGGKWYQWITIGNDADIAGLQSQITTLNSKAVKSIGLYPNDLNFANGKFSNYSVLSNGTPDKNGYTLVDLNDDAAAVAAANQLNTMLSNISNLQSGLANADGTKQISNAVNLNTFTDHGRYKLLNNGNANTPPWLSDHRGQLINLNYDGNAKTQIWIPVGMGALNGDFGWRYWEGNSAAAWLKATNSNDLANYYIKSQIDSAFATRDKNITNANNNANGRLPLGGGNMNLRSTINWNGGGINDKTGNLGGITWAGGTDWVKIYGDQDGNDNLDLAIQLGDDNSNHISIRNNNGAQVAAIDAYGNITSPTINSLQTQINNLTSEINYIKANYVEGKTFNNDAAAQAWQNQVNGHGVAFVTK